MQLQPAIYVPVPISWSNYHCHSNPKLYFAFRRLYSNDNHQGSHHDGKRYKCNNHNRSSTRRELALHHPLLRYKVPPVTQEQDQDTDTQKRRAQGLAHVA